MACARLRDLSSDRSLFFWIFIEYTAHAGFLFHFAWTCSTYGYSFIGTIHNSFFVVCFWVNCSWFPKEVAPYLTVKTRFKNNFLRCENDSNTSFPIECLGNKKKKKKQSETRYLFLNTDAWLNLLSKSFSFRITMFIRCIVSQKIPLFIRYIFYPSARNKKNIWRLTVSEVLDKFESTVS